MVIKNIIYEYHDYYQIYCMIKDVNPKNYKEVASYKIYTHGHLSIGIKMAILTFDI